MSIGQGYVLVTPLAGCPLVFRDCQWRFAADAFSRLEIRPARRQLTDAHRPELKPTNIKPEVIATIQGGICAVTTSPVGTAEFVFRNSPLQSLGVCGKTGTAQTGDENTNSEAWFAAYAPRENPQVVVVGDGRNGG